jgi:hypothetical protein
MPIISPSHPTGANRSDQAQFGVAAELRHAHELRENLGISFRRHSRGAGEGERSALRAVALP